MTRIETWVLSAAGLLAALGVLATAVRRTVHGLVDLVDLVRSLLQLQPRVIELAELLQQSLTEQQAWRADFDRRLTALEPATAQES